LQRERGGGGSWTGTGKQKKYPGNGCCTITNNNNNTKTISENNDENAKRIYIKCIIVPENVPSAGNNARDELRIDISGYTTLLLYAGQCVTLTDCKPDTSTVSTL
jgi:hypothetical protein